MPRTGAGNVIGYWVMTVGQLVDYRTHVGLIWRYEFLPGTGRAELWRSEYGTLIVQLWHKPWLNRRLKLYKTLIIKAPSQESEWIAVLGWWTEFLAAATTVVGSPLYLLKRRLLAS